MCCSSVGGLPSLTDCDRKRVGLGIVRELSGCSFPDEKASRKPCSRPRNPGRGALQSISLLLGPSLCSRFLNLSLTNLSSVSDVLLVEEFL